MFKKKKISFSEEATIMYWLPPSEKYTHNAIVWDGKEFKLYINGEFQDYKSIQYESGN